MMPIGPLMIEHRLIERMLKVVGAELVTIEKAQRVNPVFIDKVVDFVRVYADRSHHGKEERILFRELSKKTLSADHRKTMEELLDEHQWGRETVAELVAAKEAYLRGEEGALETIVRCLSALTTFYPKHIEKEDRHFFMPIMGYFTQGEKDALLEEGYAFDRDLIHAIYRERVEEAEKGAGMPAGGRKAPRGA